MPLTKCFKGDIISYFWIRVDTPRLVTRSARPINVKCLPRSKIISFQGDDSGKWGDTMAGDRSSVWRLRHGIDAWMERANSWISHRWQQNFWWTTFLCREKDYRFVMYIFLFCLTKAKYYIGWQENVRHNREKQWKKNWFKEAWYCSEKYFEWHDRS